MTPHWQTKSPTCLELSKLIELELSTMIDKTCMSVRDRAVDDTKHETGVSCTKLGVGKNKNMN